MSKKLNVSGLFSSEPLPSEEEEESLGAKEKVASKRKKAKAASGQVSKLQNGEKLGKEIPTASSEENDGDSTNVRLSLNLGRIKKKKPIDYISFKLKRDIHSKLSKIAKKENIDYTGNLIHLVLEDFVKQYQSKDD